MRSTDGEREFLSRLDRLHTTELGVKRIRENLGLETEDVVGWCREKIREGGRLERRGKNWYGSGEDWVITVNAASYTIITAHRRKRT